MRRMVMMMMTVIITLSVPGTVLSTCVYGLILSSEKCCEVSTWLTDEETEVHARVE